MKLSLLAPLVVFAVLAGLLYTGLERDPRAVPSPLVGRPLPAFALPGVRDPEHELRSEEIGTEPGLLNVWASWCAACRVEHPLLLSVAEEAPVYGLNYKDEREDAVRWLDRFGDPYRNSGHDREGRVGLDLGVYGVPETFVVDHGGRIVHKHTGPLAPEDWEETIRPLLRRLRAETG